jgi:hypothetical protein
MQAQPHIRGINSYWNIIDHDIHIGIQRTVYSKLHGIETIRKMNELAVAVDATTHTHNEKRTAEIKKEEKKEEEDNDGGGRCCCGSGSSNRGSGSGNGGNNSIHRTRVTQFKKELRELRPQYRQRHDLAAFPGT